MIDFRFRRNALHKYQPIQTFYEGFISIVILEIFPQANKDFFSSFVLIILHEIVLSITWLVYHKWKTPNCQKH